MSSVPVEEEKLTGVGGGNGATPGGDKRGPPDTVSKNRNGGREVTRQQHLLPTENHVSKAWQGWEELQKLLTKLGNQTTTTEKVQRTQMPKQADSEETGQASRSESEAGLQGSAVAMGNDYSSTACKRPAPRVSMKNMSPYNLVTHHRPCPLAHFEAGAKETL